MDRKYRCERLDGSRMVSPSACDISAIVIMPTAAAYAIVTLYDGASTGDPKILTIQSATTETKTVNFVPPLHTLRGLYVDLTTDCDEVMVCYDPVEG